MKRITLLSLLALLLFSELSAATPYYLQSSSGGYPWGRSNYTEDMDAVFGVGEWINERFETVDPDDLFSSANDFIYMEGSDRHAQEMEDFITANLIKMEAWVYAGGTLFLNAAPNEGDGMYFGFGASLIYSDSSSTVTAVDPEHDIFHQPFGVTGDTFTGNSFAHATVSGDGLNSLLQGTSGRSVLAEKTHGRGVAFFGGITSRYYHSPKPQVSFLHQNILKYQATVIGASLSYLRHINIKPGGDAEVKIIVNNRDDFPINVDVTYPFSTLSVSGPANITIDALQSLEINVDVSSAYIDSGQHTVTVNFAIDGGEEITASISVGIISFEQITQSNAFGSAAPSISSDGNLIMFVSNADLAGTGKPTSSKDVFLFDVKQNVMSQITNNPPGYSCTNAVVSGNGLFAASLCNSALDDEKVNSDRNYELYYFDLTTGVTTQVNSDSRTYGYNESGQVAINHDGRNVYFASNSNLDSVEGNSDGSAEVFVYEHGGTGSIKQLSHFNYSNHIKSISTDYNGERFVVSARGNPFGENSRRYYRIFSGNVSDGILKQITSNTSRDSYGSAISGNGEYIVFNSRSSFDPTSYTNDYYQIYRTGFEGGVFEQVTPPNSNNSYGPSISNDGSKIVFYSSASFNTTNYSANNEVYLKDFKLDELKAMTEVNGGGGATDPKISADGSAFVFDGDADWLTGENSLFKNQIFYQDNMVKRDVRAFREDDEEEDEEKRIYSNSHTFIVIAEGDDDEEEGLGSIHPAFILFLSLLFIRSPRVKRLRVVTK